MSVSIVFVRYVMQNNIGVLLTDMRYRIIEEFDGNGTCGYYCEIWTKGFLFSGWHWKMVKRRFSSVERIHEYVRSIDIKRKLVAEYEA